MKSHQIVVVRISSWRLARRAVVTCFLSIDAVCVVLPHDVHEMTVHEKIEYAQDLKTEASSKFGLSNYNEALKLYAKAVDAVRNVQHTSGSSNEMRYVDKEDIPCSACLPTQSLRLVFHSLLAPSEQIFW